MDLRRVAGTKPTPADVLAWLDFKWHERWSGFWGTLAFRVKAALFGVHVDGRVRAWGPTVVMRYPGSRIAFRNGVDLISSAKRAWFAPPSSPVWIRTTSPQASIEIGERVSITGATIACRSTSVTVGEGTMIAVDVTITDTDSHALWPADSRRATPAIDEDRPVSIGCDVWLAKGCTVLKGVTIGDGAVVGTMSVVTGDLPANCLAVGSPARVVRMLDAADNAQSILGKEQA